MMSRLFLAGDIQSLKWSLSVAVCRVPSSSIWSHERIWHQNELFGQCFSTVITFRSQSSDLWDILDAWIDFPRIDLNYLPALPPISVSLCFLLPACCYLGPNSSVKSSGKSCHWSMRTIHIEILLSVWKKKMAFFEVTSKLYYQSEICFLSRSYKGIKRKIVA